MVRAVRASHDRPGPRCKLRMRDGRWKRCGAMFGFLVCGLSVLLADLDAGTVVLPYPASAHLVAPHPFRLQVRPDAAKRPHVRRFVGWLRAEADATRQRIEGIIGAAG